MLLLLCSPRLLLRLSPSHNLPPASFVRPRPRLRRRSTALRAEPEPPPSTSAAEPPDAGDADSGGGEGPVELGALTLFSVDENPTPLQTATSVLLTGAISVFLFRSLRRRARRTKELRVRSGGLQNPKNLSEEALEGLRLVSASPIETDKPPSPVQALLGGIAAGVIALILYKFTTTIEAALNRQTISDNFSLTFASIMDDDSSNSPGEKTSEQSNTRASSNSSTGSTSNRESASSDMQQISDKSKNSTE